MHSSFLVLSLLSLSLAATAQPAAPTDPSTAPIPTRAAALPVRPLGTHKPTGFGDVGNLTILPIPVLFYQQETGVGYGIGGLLSGRFGDTATTRPSNIRAQYWTYPEGTVARAIGA